jgi:hypothetical protein
MSDTDAKNPQSDRKGWVQHLQRMAEPVLAAAAEGKLRERMPVEQHSQAAVRNQVTYLEAVGRLLAGIAPWLEVENLPTGPEKDLQYRYRDLARKTIVSVTNATSPDYCNFTQYGQPLVDSAFLAQALVRAPVQLIETLSEKARFDLIKALKATRGIQPPFNNWLLLPAMIEAALHRLGSKWEPLRVEVAIRQHEQWYRGDGLYSDGPVFHLDYYNSLVIQPMLLDTLQEVGPVREWISADYPKVVLKRAQRAGALLERMISPEATFPPIGRSLSYRTGAMQLLAQLALKDTLPKGVKPGQVRAALAAVTDRMMNAPGTYDDDGWLRIGFCGNQASTGENYISTGSLYLCAAVLLPLGLPPDHPFWTADLEPWTAQKLWSGKHAPIDQPLSDRSLV